MIAPAVRIVTQLTHSSRASAYTTLTRRQPPAADATKWMEGEEEEEGEVGCNRRRDHRTAEKRREGERELFSRLSPLFSTGQIHLIVVAVDAMPILHFTKLSSGAVTPRLLSLFRACVSKSMFPTLAGEVYIVYGSPIPQSGKYNNFRTFVYLGKCLLVFFFSAVQITFDGQARPRLENHFPRQMWIGRNQSKIQLFLSSCLPR